MSSESESSQESGHIGYLVKLVSSYGLFRFFGPNLRSNPSEFEPKIRNRTKSTRKAVRSTKYPMDPELYVDSEYEVKNALSPAIEKYMQRQKIGLGVGSP